MTIGALSAGLGTALALAAGLAVGWGYFAVLRWTVELYAGSRGRLGAVALTLARMAAVIAFLGAVARFGALPLLAAFLGFLAARSQALRAVRRTT